MNKSNAQTLLVLTCALDATIHKTMVGVRNVHFKQRQRASRATEQRIVAFALVSLATTSSSAVALFHFVSLDQSVTCLVAERAVVASGALTPAHIHALSMSGTRNSLEQRTVQPADLDFNTCVGNRSLHQHSQRLFHTTEGRVGVVQSKTSERKERRDAGTHCDVGVGGTDLDIVT